MTAPILKLPDFSSSSQIYADASAVLIQLQASRSCLLVQDAEAQLLTRRPYLHLKLDGLNLVYGQFLYLCHYCLLTIVFTRKNRSLMTRFLQELPMYNYEPATKYIACYVGPQEMLSQLNQGDGSPVKDMPAESPTSTKYWMQCYPNQTLVTRSQCHARNAARRAVDCTLLMVY